jgi:hypothetical protein
LLIGRGSAKRVSIDHIGYPQHPKVRNAGSTLLGSANRVQDHQTTGYAREVIAAVVSDIATLGVHRRARIRVASPTSARAGTAADAGLPISA